MTTDRPITALLDTTLDLAAQYGVPSVVAALADQAVGKRRRVVGQLRRELQRVQNQAPSLIIESARELSPAVQEEVRKNVVDQGLQTPQFTVNPALVGGFRLHRQGKVVDASHATYVRQLQQILEVSHAA